MSLSRERAAPAATPPEAFRFGRNWQRYVATYLDPGRERIAAESLHQLVGDLRGKSFLDIGCGSGLFSLCAYRDGAREVVSFDVDRESVDASRQLWQREGSPERWSIRHGSILDLEFVGGLQTADVVYSWGVLHHTGDMYAAIRNAASLVAPGGKFAIAIYNHATGTLLDSYRWRRIKRTYNQAPRPAQRAMELGYGLRWVLGQVRNRRNPVRAARSYRHSRGMAIWTDLSSACTCCVLSSMLWL